MAKRKPAVEIDLFAPSISKPEAVKRLLEIGRTAWLDGGMVVLEVGPEDTLETAAFDLKSIGYINSFRIERRNGKE